MDAGTIVLTIVLSGLFVMTVGIFAFRLIKKHGLARNDRNELQARQFGNLIIALAIIAAGLLFYVVLPLLITTFMSR